MTRLLYALVLALGIAAGIALTGCQLSSTGRAAVATRIAVEATDKACTALLDAGNAYLDEAVTACAPVAMPRACFDDRVRARLAALEACRVYGEARGSVAAREAVVKAMAVLSAP